MTDRVNIRRLPTGVPGLDQILGGGVPEFSFNVIAGPSGSGTSVLASEFIVEGARHGEPGIIAVFEKRPNDSYTDLRFSPHGTAFLTDAIIMQRYIVFKGARQRIMAVVKVRGSMHSKELRAFEITEDGLVLGDILSGYDGLLTGSPEISDGASKAADVTPRRRKPSRPARG